MGIKLGAKGKKTLLDRVEKDLENLKIVPFENDKIDQIYLNLPKDITEVDSKELGRYLNAFTQQKMWVRTNIGRVGVLIRDIKRDFDKIKAEIFSQLPTKMSVKEKELRVAEGEQALVHTDKLDFYEGKLEMLEDYLANLEDAIFNISREITRRGEDWKDFNREHNAGGIRRGHR
jgi:predicted NACHT family NTPase